MQTKPAALKLFACTLRDGCDAYASSASKQKEPKYLSVVVSGSKHDRFWLQGTVVALREKQSFVLDDGTATLLVRAQMRVGAHGAQHGEVLRGQIEDGFRRRPLGARV